MPSLRPLRYAPVIAFLVVSASPHSGAQNVDVTNQTMPQTPSAGHNLLGTLNESVSPANGLVSLKLSLPVPPGRKLTLPFTIGFTTLGTCYQPQTPGGVTNCTTATPFGGGGWSFMVPSFTRLSATWTPTTALGHFADLSTVCSATTAYIFTDASGAQHSFPVTNIFNWWGQIGVAESDACAASPYINAHNNAGGDPLFSAAVLQASSGNYSNTNANMEGLPTFVAPDGTQYGFPTTGNDSSVCQMTNPNAPPNGIWEYPQSVADRNGNSVAVSYVCNNTTNTLSVTDTLGRPAISASWVAAPSAGSTDSVTVAGLSQPYKLNWTTVSWNGGGPALSSQAITAMEPDPNECTQVPYPNEGSGGGGSGSFPAVTSVTLPNGQSYQITYDPTSGALKQIKYPSGGTITYTWRVNPLSDMIQFWSAHNHECAYEYDTMAVASRVVSFDGTHSALEQDFSYNTAWSTTNPGTWTSKTTTVTTKDLVRGTSFTTVYTYGQSAVAAAPNPPGSAPANTVSGPKYFPPTYSLVEARVQYYDTTGTLLKTVDKGWADAFSLACQLTTVGTSGPTSGTFYTYGAGDQITDIKEYDYGILSEPSTPGCTVPQTPPTPTRETVTSYTTFPTPTGFAGPVLLDKPSTIKVYAGGTSGTLMAEADITYDNGTPSVGNATKTVKRCIPSGSACSQGDAVTNFTYDSNGQVTSMTDAKNNTTQYSYTDVYSGMNCAGNAPPTSPSDAYLTTITYPTTNGVAHTVGYCYDYKTGLLLTSKDENSQITAYKYADSLNRLTETDDPDGGQTTISYSDTAPNPSATTTKKINASQSETSTAIMDGLGHVIETQLASDPQGTDDGVTVYDGLGRVYSAYNPTRCSTPSAPSPWNLPTNCGTETTWGATTYTYDALGRTLQVKHPDGSSAQTQYTGRAVEVTDEGNGAKTVQRISQADGLGRLLDVCEVTNTNLAGNGGTASDCGSGVTGGLDIDAKGFLTTYTYDVLGNLQSVSQGTMNGRSFTYDSLSHLLTATNPESGTITYTYDVNGNLATKADARGIVTNYSPTASPIDALNRVTEITYSDGTPTVNFAYDVCPSSPACPSGDSHQYTTGRLVATYTSQTREFESYDPMGRVQDEWQCTPYNCSGTPWHLNNVYDVGGDATSFTNGMGTTFSQTFDSAARLSQFTSSWNDSQHPGTLVQGTCATGVNNSGLCYNALSDVVTANLGNGLTESLVYGVRAELQSETVSNGTGSTPATGLLTINGSEQSYNQSATPSTATIEIASPCNTSCGSGTVTVTINSVQGNANWSGSLSNEAAAIATAARNTGLVTATSSNVTSGVWKAVLTSIASGTSADYSLSCDTVPNLSQCPSTMTGGQNGGTVYDAGTVTATVNGHPDSVSYGQTSTFTGLASALATAINNDGGASVTAVVNGEVVSLTSKASGAGANYTMSVSVTSGNPTHFSPPSFSMQDSGPSLVGGTGGYGYDLAYAPNGDLLAANDSVNGNWFYTYDDFNRLVASSCSSHCPDNQNTQAFSYVYDRYANRWQQNVTAGTGPQPQLSFTGNNNRMDTYSYDASGNLLNDGTHSYTYDAESRIIKVDNGTTAAYVYDAEGRRVQKTTASGTVNYVYDIAGQQVAEVNSSGVCNRCEVYAGGHHVATYANSTTYFDHADWLGTERMRTQVSGASCETIVSLAFGDGQATTGSCDPTPMHFTGKQRDTETNLDDFDARYYSSQWGRFISADWSAVPAPVPYANLANPQTLNLYAIVADDPVTDVDDDGHTLLLQGTDAQIDAAQDFICEQAGPDCADFTYNPATHMEDFNCGSQGKTACDELSPGAEHIKEMIDGPGTFVLLANKLGPGNYSFQYVQVPPREPSNDTDPILFDTAVTAGIGWASGAIRGTASIIADIIRGGGRTAAKVAVETAAKQAVESTGVQLTEHAAQRLAQRGITQAMVDEAVSTAERTGAITSQIGKYGTIQHVYQGTNGITVVVETEGRNAGKAITAWVTGSNP